MANSKRYGHDVGPWIVFDCNTIWSEDFTHDVALKISGDFADDAQRMQYAENLCAQLNGNLQQISKEDLDAVDLHTTLLFARGVIERLYRYLGEDKAGNNERSRKADLAEIDRAITTTQQAGEGGKS